MNYYFIQPASEEVPLPSEWFNQLQDAEEVIIPSRLYKTVECNLVSLRGKNNAPFLLTTARIDQTLKSDPTTFQVAELGAGVKFYHNHEFGFIESHEPRLDDAVQIFRKLVERASGGRVGPIVFFLEDRAAEPIQA